MNKKLKLVLGLFAPLVLLLAAGVFHKPLARAYYIMFYPKIMFDNSERCVQELQSAKLAIAPVSDYHNAQGCRHENVFQFKNLHIEQNKPVILTCRMITSLSAFEKEILQPKALEIFKQNIQKIENWGTYNSCRKQRKNKYILSRHAFADAIDIAGFHLADGTYISVEKDWDGPGRKSRFLHEVAKEACSYFSKVLTPEFDNLHKNHFHLDQSFWPRCYD
ncbi:extensin family protein [Deltaproteobacteria bacterium TL4]